MTKWLVKSFVRDSENVADNSVRADYGRLAGWVGIICNLLLATGKLAAGILSGSLAVAADAVNNFSDAASSIVTLIGFWLASKPADSEHPFGHARYEYIAGLGVAVMIIVVGIELGKGSVQKIIEPTPVDFSVISIAILAVSIAVKMWMAFFNRAIGKKIGSTTLEATFKDSRNDVIATGVLLLSVFVTMITGLNLDGWLGLGVAAFIIFSGIGLVRETMNPLLGEAPDPKFVDYVKKKIESYDGVLGTHDLIVHDYGPGRRFASAHVEMPSDVDVMKSHNTIDNIERDFMNQDNLNLIIHYDPIVTGNAAINSARAMVTQRVKEIDHRLTIHDFRMVDGPGHVNYIFDVVVPPEFELTDKELKKRINASVQNGDKKAYAVVTVDSSYAPIPCR